MSYRVGIDLGTTHATAAIYRSSDDRPEVAQLGVGSASVATVVLLADDGSLVVGEVAGRRAAIDPGRVVREFVRRVGDDTPMLVGGRCIAADTVAARFVQWVLTRIAEAETGPAEAVTLTHPVCWGAHKRERLAAALAAEGVEPVEFLAAPLAAAIGNAHGGHQRAGGVVAVYDLSGGTFEAAVVRTHDSSDSSGEILGRPTGIEHLGGDDLDQAVLDHVVSAIGPHWQRLDGSDPTIQAAVAGLRRECSAAKESLCTDTEVTIPVALPGLRTQVRLTRAEFEDSVHSTVGETVESLRRAIAQSGVGVDDLTALLLVGGSSRIPLITELLSTEVSCPVAADVDPGTVVAVGAAVHAARSARDGSATAAHAGPVILPADGPSRPVWEPELVVQRDHDAAERIRSRGRSLVMIAAASVVAALALAGTVASGTRPLDTGTGSSGVAAADEPGRGVAAPPDGVVDPWTGAAPEDTTPPGPVRPAAAVAAAPPTVRTEPFVTDGAPPVTEEAVPNEQRIRTSRPLDDTADDLPDTEPTEPDPATDPPTTPPSGTTTVPPTTTTTPPTDTPPPSAQPTDPDPDPVGEVPAP